MRLDPPTLAELSKAACNRPRLATVVAAGLLWACPLFAETSITPEQEEFFEKQVRPIFVENCLECHGPKKQEASLRFDSSSAVRKGSENGPVIDTKNPAASKLLAAIEQSGDAEMPPDGKLPHESIAAIQKWLEMGAPWPPKYDAELNGLSIDERARSHWAFQPVARPAIPDVANPLACNGPVDRFLLARLEAKGLSFSPRADRRTWIRRATYDLLGLPPTIDDIEQFEKDPAPDAFERCTDRLLASPHYGEKWARHWLDVARYADTKGYVFTAERRYPFAFTFRDYVIRSLNEDLPYDQFVKEQIAADKLTSSQDKRPLAAMGFLTLGRRFLNNTNDVIDDRIDVVSRGFLGLTVGCARCHDHKYDPIPTADYYSLYSVFASSIEPGELPIVAEADSPAQREAFQKATDDNRRQIDAYIHRKTRQREDLFRRNLATLVLAAYETGGNADDPKLAEVARQIGTNDRTARLFVRKWQSFLSARLSPRHPIFGLWAMFLAAPQADFSSRSGQIVEQLRSDTSGMGIHPAVARQFHDAAPKDMRQVVEGYGKALASDAPEDLRKVLEEPGSPLRLTGDEAVGCFDMKEREELQRIRNRIEELKATHPGAPLQAMAMQDGPVHDTHILVRGNPNRPGDAVPRRFLAILDNQERKPFTDGSGRRELAERIVDPKNPLTARVMINRIWHWHFTRGIVPTPSDFGVRSEAPTHPELLDWLASEFVESGWSIKAMHRAMMTSAAYRQCSQDQPEAREADPENNLLWAFRRRRLELEELRDSLLVASSELDGQMFGRPAKLTGDNPTKRRAVYAFIDRQNLEGLFRTFDFANPNTSAPLRFVTTVPQQALFLMNSRFVLDQCRSLSSDPEWLAQPSIERQIEALYQRVLSRSPEPPELQAAREFLSMQVALVEELPPLAWRYGFGKWDRQANNIASFTPMSHWSGRQWQTGRSYPDPDFGHLALSADGGHPGVNGDRAAVRRWVAPRSMRISIRATVLHPSDKGDGIDAIIASSRRGALASWHMAKDKRSIAIDDVAVEAGEAIDFVADPRANNDSDGFQWQATIESLQDNATNRTAMWDSVRDFSPPGDMLSGWEKLAHVLVLTNEFSFID